MSRFLFVTVDAGGNIPPLLAIARSLAGMGHEVEIAGMTAPRDAGSVPDGVRLIPLQTTAFYDSTSARTLLRAVSLFVRLATSDAIAQEVVRTVSTRKPDAVVVDPLMPAVVQAVARTGAPTAVLLHTFLTFWTGHLGPGPVAKLYRLFGADPVRCWQQANLVLVATDRDLDISALAPARAEAAIAALPHARWVGSTETGLARTHRRSQEPMVLVSLSSTFMPGQDAVYRRIIEALGALPVRAIVTTGGAEIGHLPAPANVSVRARTDHSGPMREASMLIGHGGHSTTLRALAHDLPAVILPLNPLIDQPLVGRAVEAAGAGRMLPPKATPAQIAATAGDILTDRDVADAAATIGARVRARDGAQAAADLLVQLVGGTIPTLSAAPDAG